MPSGQANAKSWTRFRRVAGRNRPGDALWHNAAVPLAGNHIQRRLNPFRSKLSGNEIKNLTPPPHAAWIQANPREIDEPLTLGLLHESLYLTKCANDLRTGLDGVEKDFDLTIELEGYTKADIPDLELDGITILNRELSSIDFASTRRLASSMSRPLRSDYPKAWHLVMDRLGRGQDLFIDKKVRATNLNVDPILRRIQSAAANRG
jgi:hypothetical protein